MCVFFIISRIEKNEKGLNKIFEVKVLEDL